MGELFTYSLSDFLMFSPETYFRMFERYNAAIWPGQWLALAMGVVVIVLARVQGALRGRVIAILLAGSWLWIAWRFFLGYYAEINLAAPYFAGAFAAQGLFLVIAAINGGLRFGWNDDRIGRAGLALVIFSLAVFPCVSPLTGRGWAGMELFALTPDPTAIGTLGVLLMTRSMARWPLSVIPLLWSVASGLTYGMMEITVGMITPIAALISVGLMIPGRAGVSLRKF